MQLTIYHNPRCSKSRQTLALLEQRGLTPEIIEYLKTPPDARTLRHILEALGIGPRELLRPGEQEYKDLNLGDPDLGDAEIIEAMVRHPRLIQRPIVVRDDQARIGRPPERVLEILS